MISKLFIVPWFGKLSDWHDRWLAQLPAMREMGYDFLVTHDLSDFAKRAFEATGIEPQNLYGTRKLCDWRPLFGVMYADKIKDYEFWGFVDTDVVFGRVDKWVTDEFLNNLDVHSNHHSYICGPWTLFRTGVTEELFKKVPNWEANLKTPELTGWAETTFSRALEKSGLRYKYTFWQPQDLSDMSGLSRNAAGELFQNGEPLFQAHFRRTKSEGWPLKD